MDKGKETMGVPTKEADQLVDDILDGNYGKVKVIEQATDMVDVILDMCGKDHNKKKKAVKEETEYQKFFKSTLQKYGVDSPDKLEGEKKKEFFDKIDKGWKGKKEVAEVVNAIDHVPEEDADEATQKLKDEMGKEEKYRAETAEELITKAYNLVIEDKAVMAEAEAAVELNKELRK